MSLNMTMQGLEARVQAIEDIEAITKIQLRGLVCSGM
jgi:hypothetical protein